MRKFILFYSWQSDRPSKLCRNFIETALKSAAETIFETRQITVIIDSDTQGVSGTPPVSETILRKIDVCDGFLADLTLVCATDAGKASPNPNVLIEYGYALKTKGPHHLILAMNNAFGGPESLPFDLKHLRHPLQYTAGEDVLDRERRLRRSTFAADLVRAINAVIDRAPARKPAAGKSADLETAARKRFADHLSQRASGGAEPLMISPRLTLDILPVAAQTQHRLSLQAVKAARPWFAPANTPEIETSTGHGDWVSCDPPRDLNYASIPMSFWATRLVSPGHIERAFVLGEPGLFNLGQTVEGVKLDRDIIDALRRSGELARAVGLVGPAIVSLKLSGVESLTVSREGHEAGVFGRRVLTFGPVRIADLQDIDAADLRPLLDDLWQAAGWEDGTPSITDEGWGVDPTPLGDLVV